MKQWYESLFENYGKKYDNENFTQGTIGECDFIEKEIDFNKSLKIIDIGCGTGAHLYQYQKVMCQVFGVDTSPSMLELAKHKLGEKADLHLVDARTLPYSDNHFDIILFQK